MSLKQEKRLGFTLVEMSIVLIIIGLVIGGVLVGRELIHASKIRTTASLFHRYVAAAYAFQGKYQYLPGDIPTAKVHTYGLAACLDSGDNLIITADGPLDGCHFDFWATTGNGTIDRLTREQGNFFQHLSAAGMIEGGYTYSGWTTGGASWGASPLDTVYFPDSINSASGNYEVGGPSFAIGVSFTGFFSTSSTADIFDHFSPYDGYGLDAKLDDGSPFRGTVFVIREYDIVDHDEFGVITNSLVNGVSPQCCSGPSSCSSDTDNYDIGREAKLCTLAIQW